MQVVSFCGCSAASVDSSWMQWSLSTNWDAGSWRWSLSVSSSRSLCIPALIVLMISRCVASLSSPCGMAGPACGDIEIA
eukprot:CAMPEP_0202845522 /NCGR_PEP_ID=MMETSP1389-20130828/70201_1 /ASSEMBLY_ACC=CAM_ASM_000865 /TAXON_ID=302021 /ORGANISM="Rhodomonas sp., Strain CCMP768" /LENGTH=78 /DNA_ID=CAMNT_0049522979 /DNA_START=255 /DNA_END=488 /DNA_ORIENTATION=-